MVPGEGGAVVPGGGVPAMTSGERDALFYVLMLVALVSFASLMRAFRR